MTDVTTIACALCNAKLLQLAAASSANLIVNAECVPESGRHVVTVEVGPPAAPGAAGSARLS